jgi:hypothetical protein
MVAPLVLALAACGASAGQHGLTPTATPSPTVTPVAHGPVVEVTTTQHFADSKSGGTAEPCANGDPLISGDCGVTVTATCPQGAPVLSGGYTLDGGFVSSSYPSASGAWTITAHDEGQDNGSHPVTVTAYADCLQANFTATTQDVSSTPNVPADGNYYAESVRCSNGSVLTGGGFRGTNSTAFSMPSDNNWRAGLAVQLHASAKPMLYAVCANSHLTAAGTLSTAKTFTADTSGTVSVACAPDQILVGGGSKGDGGPSPSFALSEAATTDVSHWQVQVHFNVVWGGPVAPKLTETVYAVCMTVA